jgi:hypothetical protein
MLRPSPEPPLSRDREGSNRFIALISLPYADSGRPGPPSSIFNSARFPILRSDTETGASDGVWRTMLDRQF